MSAAVATAPAVRRPSPFAHALRRQLAVALFLAGWFWAIAAVCLVTATLVVWAVNGSVDVAIAVYARQASTWFPFSQAILLVAALLRPHVAAGMTRRTFVRASLVTAVLTGLLYSAVLVGLLLLERAVHDAVGWDTVITEVGLAATGSSVATLVLDLVPSLVVANLSGLLVGIVYQRAGGWWGTVTLPLTVAPILATWALAGTWTGLWIQGWLTDRPLVTVLAAVLVAAATAVAYVLVARSAPVRTPR